MMDGGGRGCLGTGPGAIREMRLPMRAQVARGADDRAIGKDHEIALAMRVRDLDEPRLVGPFARRDRVLIELRRDVVQLRLAVAALPLLGVVLLEQGGALPIRLDD